jgi:predicted nucleic-acid-binding protein
LKVTVDTNVLVRAVTEDDPAQAEIAKRILREAEIAVLTVPVLCELVWVLSSRYKISAQDIGEAIQALTDGSNVATDQQTVESGLAMLAGGGDFADGVIAYEGEFRGADTFVSFDRKAVKLLQAQGHAALTLSRR